MANTVSRFTGTDPNGDIDIMAKLTITSAGFFHLADIAKEDSYTLRLWVKASTARTVTAYIGVTPFAMSVTTDWNVFTYTSAAAANSSCDLYLPTGTYYIWHPMLEMSTKASDYRQAPEDVQENINAVADNAAATAAAYTDMRLVEFVTTEQLDTAIRQTQDEISLSVNKQTSRSMTYAYSQAAKAYTAANAATDNKLLNYITTTRYTSDLRILSDRITSAVTATETLAQYVDGEFYNQITNEYTSAITQTANSIESRVQQTYATQTTVNGLATRVTTAESRITQQANQITSVVSELATAESSITQQANQITSLINTVNGQQSSINQNAYEIDLCVKSANLVSEINASSGQITMRSNRFVVQSTYFNLTANGTVTASNMTLTGGTIKSSNYSAGTAGTLINLSTGAISAKNFSLSSTGVITATSATLNDATITGSLKTTNGSGYTTWIRSGQIETIINNSRVGVLVPVRWTYNSRSLYQLALLASTNYQGLAFGAVYNDDITTYYRLNINEANTQYGCRHLFVGDLKFTDGRVKSCIDFEDNYGLSWGGNIALRYYNGSSPYGVWLGIGGEYACPTVLVGSKIMLGANTEFTGTVTSSLSMADNCGIVYGSNIAFGYYNNVSNPGVFVGISGSQACNTYIRGSEIHFKATAYTSSNQVVTSDRRKKKNIKDLDSRYTALMDNLSDVTFQYKENRPDQTNCGFIAQDVIAAMEKAGLEPKDFGGFHDHYGDGKDLYLDYMQFIPIMWEILKELRRKIS